LRYIGEMFQHDGTERPPFAVIPGPGQESVWDYPRPPRLAPDTREVVVCAAGREIARTRRAIRLLETASPPTFYLPPEDVQMAWLQPASASTSCEWKGRAAYWDAVIGQATGPRIEAVAWSYPEPKPAFEPIRGYLAFYPARVECFVEGVRVEPQPGRFYGGWITPEIVGPFKGGEGTSHW
jgi:uncharacterized protein (DUF427 family)